MKDDNLKKIRTVLWVILFANFFVAAVKLIVGTLIKSASLTADGFHSLTDGSSNIVGLVGVRLAAKPVDEDHPYGHRKYETFAGLFIGVMLTIIGSRIVYSAVMGFRNPKTPSVSLESLIALIITLVINIFVAAIEYKQGKKLKSQVLVSDSLHTKSDIFVSLGVIVTLVGIKLGLPAIIDPIASLVVGGFIFAAAWEIFKSCSEVLLDKAIIEDEKIVSVISEFSEVKGVHKIRSRGTGKDIYVDMHILTEPDMSVENSHKLIHSIEKEMQTEIDSSIQVIVHIEPYYENH
jgi:cation diffusion facilitator family transporter